MYLGICWKWKEYWETREKIDCVFVTIYHKNGRLLLKLLHIITNHDLIRQRL